MLLHDGHSSRFGVFRTLFDCHVQVSVIDRRYHEAHDTHVDGHEDVSGHERSEGEPIHDWIAEVRRIRIVAVEVVVGSEYPDIP